MEIKIFKTEDISENLWNDIARGFNSCFDYSRVSGEKLKVSAARNHFGYCYHAIGFDGNRVIAFNTIIPNWYYYGDLKIKVGLSGSTFTIKEYRKDIFIFKRLYDSLRKFCKEEGLCYFLGVPNDNSYQYSMKLLNCKEIFNLSYYVLPLRISKILNNRRWRYFDWLSFSFSVAMLFFSRIVTLLFNFKESKKSNKILVTENFLNGRFNEKHYSVIRYGAFNLAYTICVEESCVCAYIMDFRESLLKTSRALNKIIIEILKRENVDAIMYVGTLNVKQCSMLRVPHSFDPKKMRLTYNILDDTIVDETKLSNKNSWDFSLLNLDVR